MAFELRSPAFADRQRIPEKYTADGEDISPPLEWSGPPEGTRSFALIVEDPDAPTGTFRHWGVYNILPGRDRLPEGVGHDAQAQDDLGVGVNDFGEPGYCGPAPPKGHGTHHYQFTLLALDVEGLAQRPKMTIADLWKATVGHVLDQTELVGTYSR